MINSTLEIHPYGLTKFGVNGFKDLLRGLTRH